MQDSSILSGSASLADHPSPGPKGHDARQRGSGVSRVWWTPLILLMITLLVVAALIAAPPAAAAPISVLSQLLSMLFCLGCTLWMLRRAERGRARWAWGVIALAQFLFAVGDVVLIVLATSPDASPTSVSLADVFFIPLAPLTAVGAILFPAAHSSLAKQVRIILDVSIAVGALLGLALVFLIAPRVVSGTSTDLIFIAYPVTDLTLLLALVVLLVRGVESTSRSVFLWLLVGMVALIYADSAYNYLSLPGLGGPTYSPGLPYVDPFWVVTAFAFSLAPLSVLRQRKHPGPSWTWLDKLTVPSSLLRPAGLLNQFLLLVLPVAVLIGLLLFINFDRTRQGTNVPLLLLTALVVLLIISRQILTQRDLVDARIATERALQLDALKDEFITSVNHEVRTPLMTMQGYIHILGEPEVQQISSSRRAEMLARAKRACDGLVHLVESILSTRTIESEAADFTPEVVSLRAAAEAALSLLDPQEVALSSRPISLQIPENLFVWGDTVRIQQIMTNLLSNAIKYSPQDAPVSVAAHPVVKRHTSFLRWTRGVSSPQTMVEITVQDHGFGIPPDQQELLFRRFVRLPRDIASNVHGNGLGLYLCLAYAQAMGGTIWIESSGVPGEGSTFHLRLPATSTLDAMVALKRAGQGQTQGESSPDQEDINQSTRG